MVRILLAILFILVCFFASFGVRKLPSPIGTVILIFMILIVALRPSTMVDYIGYVNDYKYKSEHSEPIYQLLYYVLHKINFKVIAFFFVMAVLTVTIKWYAIKRMTNLVVLSLLLWLSNIIVIQDMIAIRAALASSLLLWIIYFKVSEQKVIVWLFFALAVCAHYSALVFVFIPFMSAIKDYRKGYLAALILAMFFPLLNMSILDLMPSISSAYDYLVEVYKDQKEANPYNILVLARVLIAFILWGSLYKIESKNKYYTLSIKVYTIGCILFFLFWKQVSVAFRLGELLWVTEIIIYPYLMYLFGNRNKSICKFIPIIISIIFFLINMTNNKYWYA